MMDRRMMDVEEGRVVHRERRARKMAVVVAVQNVLVAACLLVTLYVYCDVQKQISKDNVHIQFDHISDIHANSTLNFGDIFSSNKMSVVNNEIYINCTGPYILYMNVCYMKQDNEQSGILQLKVAGRTTPVISVPLSTSGDDCRGLHSIAYLRSKEQASLHLYAKDFFKIKNVTLGLSYMLGSCYTL